MNTLALISSALPGLCLLFAALYFLARRWDNYSVVDVAWSLSFALLAGFAVLAGGGWLVRRWVVGGLVVLWSLRLGIHLWRRVAAHHPKEDGRYGRMRAAWSGRFHATMFGFFQLQAVSVVLLALPILLAMGNGRAGFHWLEVLGGVVFVLAIAGESVADAQLAAFKKRSGSSGAVCAVGLWSWSRHPNYFCEWLVWVGFALIALAAPWGWLGLLSPVAILYLLLRVTGVPATEEQALRTKGEAYRRYQRDVAAFFPRPPRTPAASVS